MKAITFHLMLSLWKQELVELIGVQKTRTKEEFNERFSNIIDIDISKKFKEDYSNIDLRSVVDLSVDEMKQEADDIYDFFVSIDAFSSIDKIRNDRILAKSKEEQKRLKQIEILMTTEL